jgi:hypothetical protein
MDMGLAETFQEARGVRARCEALFSCQNFYRIFQDFSSHRIFERMHEVLNIDKKIKLIT